MCYKTTFYDKSIIKLFERKKQPKNLGKTCYTRKLSVIAKFRMLKGLKGQKNSGISFLRHITEVLIFISTCSQMFFLKFRNIHKKTPVLEPLFGKMAGLLSQNTSGGCPWIFAAASTFFQLNLVFIGDSRIGFCPRLLWKDKLNLRSSYWSSSVKKGILRNSVNFSEKQAFRPATLLKETLIQMFSCGIYEIFKNT